VNTLPPPQPDYTESGAALALSVYHNKGVFTTERKMKMKIDFNGIIDLEIPSDDELLKVYESVKKQMDEESSYKLLVEIGENTTAMEKTEGAEGSFKKWPTIKKMAWISSEAYCMGFMNATRIVYEALIMTLQEQAAEQGGRNDAK
jgi:hypothetical protein